ncbi:PAS and ANTAR domain-containing protein [Streptomyces sp. TRM66268-LWL]|uniref:PAS and ANTAR domain-containing protein n=1 Tax=Streptomyces polyasparticus TaxID=2767826 RepID=A0ABR7SB42_9ACTN|nr:PAS and ANTAR domain-containing protein [Streptomyces polyasparticus]MBC9712700.1 PAS and ANTAR domain-containing protein [Streptomyces polyasparticus]
MFTVDSTPEASGNAGEVTGVFVHRLPEDTWWWSDEMYRLHGYEPDSVTPSIRLLRKHQHPDDAQRVAGILAAARETGEPFACYHRILDASDRELKVVLVGDGRLDDSGSVVTLRGFFIDVTHPVAQEVNEAAEPHIHRARASQAAIDQARGILMALYGIDADVALRLLRRHSQHTNTKLRDLSAAITDAAPTAPGAPQEGLHQRITRVLYTSGQEG